MDKPDFALIFVKPIVREVYDVQEIAVAVAIGVAGEIKPVRTAIPVRLPQPIVSKQGKVE